MPLRLISYLLGSAFVFGCASTSGNEETIPLCPLNISLSITEGHDVYRFIEQNELQAAFDSALESAPFPLALSRSDADVAAYNLSLIKAYVSRRRNSIAATVVVELKEAGQSTPRYYRGTELADTYWWGNSPEEVFQAAFEVVIADLKAPFDQGCNDKTLATNSVGALSPSPI